MHIIKSEKIQRRTRSLSDIRKKVVSENKMMRLTLVYLMFLVVGTASVAGKNVTQTRNEVSLQVMPKSPLWDTYANKIITCQALGAKENAQLKWIYDYNGEIKKETSGFEIMEKNNGTMSILKVSRSRNLNITCKSERYRLKDSVLIRYYVKTELVPYCKTEYRVNINETITMKCRVEFGRNSIFEWYKKGESLQRLQTGNRLTVDLYALTIRYAKLDDTGKYVLFITNKKSGDVTTFEVSLKVDQNITLTVQPQHAIFTKTKYQTLRCVAETSLNNPDLQWFGPSNKRITTDDNHIVQYGLNDNKQTNYTVVTLTFIPSSNENAGKYTCKSGKSEVEVTVKFIEKLSLNNCNKMHFVELNQTSVVIDCQISGNPKPVIEWSKLTYTIEYRRKPRRVTRVHVSEVNLHNDDQYTVTDDGLVIKKLLTEDFGLANTVFKIKAAVYETGEYEERLISLFPKVGSGNDLNYEASNYGHFCYKINTTNYIDTPATEQNSFYVGYIFDNEHYYSKDRNPHHVCATYCKYLDQSYSFAAIARNPKICYCSEKSRNEGFCDCGPKRCDGDSATVYYIRRP